jgi:hypothetical protein
LLLGPVGHDRPEHRTGDPREHLPQGAQRAATRLVPTLIITIVRG